MPTRESEQQGVGFAAKTVADHASAILRLEIELATMELKRKVTALALGIGFGVGAAIFLLFMLAFVLATIAAALATAMSTWLALLIMTVVLLGIAGVLGILALRSIKRGTPPVPEQAIREAKLTTEALKRDGASG